MIPLGILFGIGAMLVASARGYGAPTPSLAHRLAEVRSTQAPHVAAPRAAAFRTDIGERALRPLLERAGAAVRSVARLVGMDLSTTSERLVLAGDADGLVLFMGSKVGAAVLGFALFPLGAGIGVVHPAPPMFWFAAAGAGCLIPDVMLRSRARRARVAMRTELAQLCELVTLGVSAGLGLEQALSQAASSAGGRLSAELTTQLASARLHGEPVGAALERLAPATGLSEVEPVAVALSAAATQGTPIAQALRAQTRSLRERRRLELIEAAERAQVRMVLPVGVLIMPAFFLVVLFPAAIALLGVSGL